MKPVVPALACLVVVGILLPVGQGGEAAERQRFAQLLARARELAAKNEIGRSIPYWEEMARLQPYNEQALYRLALAHLYRRDVGAAAYRKGCLRAAHLLRRAAAMQERVSLRSPDLGLRYLYLGLALWYAGDALSALGAFQASYRADFERRDAVFNQLAIHEELGHETEAVVVRRELKRLSKDVGTDD